MPRFDNEIRITPSVLDRLIDYEPEMSHEPIATRSKSLQQLKQSVKRDLEWLLNTRKIADRLFADSAELNSSVAAYGFPDFTTVSLKSPADQGRMRRALESSITIFEPRLEGVTVTLEKVETEQMVRFRVDARLKIEPAPEPVTFDTTLMLASGKYTVQED